MHLTTDAKSYKSSAVEYVKTRIKPDILGKIEDFLDLSEKISVLFLMIKNHMTAFDRILKLYEKAQNEAHIIPEFLKYDNENWNEKLLEAICIIKNRQILRELGIPFTELERIYILKDKLWSVNVNPIAKCLFALCEAFSEEEAKLLIKYIAEDIGSYEPRLEQINLLEIHILYWCKLKYITISPDAKINFKALYKHLKRFDNLEIISADLEHYEKNQNIAYVPEANVYNIDLEKCTLNNNNANTEIKTITKGLCIIINQKSFAGREYQERDGTDADKDNLADTFQYFGFTVHVFENLKKSQFLKTMESIPKDFGVDYECLVFCILSHGYKGGIITADEKQVSIETIEDKLCSPKLEHVYKVCIIQACQGKVTGRMKSPLTTDGWQEGINCDNYSLPEMSNIAPYKNYCCFLSTMQRFIAIRHRIDGSWFIQELCRVLKTFGCEESFQECAQRVILAVQGKTGKIDGGPLAAQVPELRTRLAINFRFSRRSSQV